MKGKAGRKPKPTSIKIADGTYRKDRHGDPASEVHQEPLKEIPEVPPQLNETGREKWLNVANAMLGLGILEERYLPILLIYGQAWDRKTHAEMTMEEDGEFIHTEKGAVFKHPAFSVIKDCEDRICRIVSELGFTPSSSSSVHKTAVKKTGIASRGKTA